MLVKGLTRPRIRIYDLGIDILENQIVEVTTVQYSNSPDLQDYIKRGLVEKVSSGTPTPVVVDTSDVNKNTFKLNDEVVKERHIDPSFLQQIDGASVSPVFTTDPVFSVGVMQIGGLDVLSWSEANLYYKGTLYLLNAGNTTDDSWKGWNNTTWVLTLNDNGSISQRFEELPYTAARNEVLATAFNTSTNAFTALVAGISIRVPEIINNETATTDPGTSDDSTKGYGFGSLWLNTSSGDLFICASAAVDNAVWKLLG